jgi:hypothetical protein
MGNIRYLEGKLFAAFAKLEKLIDRVIDGADSTLDQMERVPVNPKNRPLEEIKMTSVSLSHNVKKWADDRL